jgi:hypothetical protein
MAQTIIVRAEGTTGVKVQEGPQEYSFPSNQFILVARRSLFLPKLLSVVFLCVNLVAPPGDYLAKNFFGVVNLSSHVEPDLLVHMPISLIYNATTYPPYRAIFTEIVLQFP